MKIGEGWGTRKDWGGVRRRRVLVFGEACEASVHSAGEARVTESPCSSACRSIARLVFCVSKTATGFGESTIGRSSCAGARFLNCASWGRPKRPTRTMGLPAATKQPISAFDQFVQSSATPPTVQPARANSESVAVPIGVLEVPIGVWGSRRVETDSGQSERVELFAEDTCSVIVFPQGAVIRLSATVAPDQLIMIANRTSGQIMLCRVVNVRTYPSIRGYAEIEFMHSATGFWGEYAPQGTMRLTARMEAETPSASADFWSNGFPKEAVSVSPNALAASPGASRVVARKEPFENRGKLLERVATIGTPPETRIDAGGRTSASQNLVLARTSSEGSAPFRIRTSLFSWWRRPTSRTAGDRASAPRRHLILVPVMSALFLLLGVFGLSRMHDGVDGTPASSQTTPTPEISLGSPIATVVQSAQPTSKMTSAATELPVAKAENFPGAQRRELADNVHFSRPSARKAASERKIANGKLLAPYSSANRLAAMGRDTPPDVIGEDANTGAGALQGVLGTLQSHGGRTKGPELLSSSPPIYPALAKQAHIEGQVTIEAVIDTTGRLTNMTVVSGSSLLQQAALDSLRTWKYQPGYLNEKPVATKTSITVNFHLQ
jgi:TonB family protein